MNPIEKLSFILLIVMFNFLKEKIKLILETTVKNAKKEILVINNISLLQVILKCEKEKKSRKTLINFIEKKIHKIKNPTNKKHTAKKDEDIRVQLICKCINNPENEYEKKIGSEFRESYIREFGKEIDKVKKTGLRNQHNDLIITHKDGTTRRCEEKGCELAKNITKKGKPWENSVQVLNGIAKNFSIGREYARIYYEKILKPRLLDQYVDVDLSYISTPTFEKWLKKDAFVCGNPKTIYGKKIKNHFRIQYGDKLSFTGQKGTPDIRPIMNQEMKKFWEKDNTIKKKTIKELQNKLNEIFEQKDCYLQTSGNILEGKFDHMWKPKILPPKITDIEIDIQKDIYFKIFTNNNSDCEFKSILRWGKGCGFSNIRFDVR
tara:strand:- start:328 stop:1458 length:1131 start_codon:yes stop_codon:yes gene_type:complete